MKKIVIAFFTTLLAAAGVSAQTVIIGEKAPDIKVSQWISGGTKNNTATLLEFFYSQSEPSKKRLPILDAIARQHGGKLNIIVISKEDPGKVAPLIDGNNYSFSVAIDDSGKTFSSYGIQYLPFSVLTDSKGRVVWSGNSSQLTNDIILKAL